MSDFVEGAKPFNTQIGRAWHSYCLYCATEYTFVGSLDNVPEYLQVERDKELGKGTHHGR